MDGVNDCADNCPATYNAKQKDTDGDGIGNDCDLPVICPASISCIPPAGLQYGSTVTLSCSLSPNNYDLLRVFVGNTKLDNVTPSLSTTLNAVGTYEVRVDYAYLMADTTGTFYDSWCPTTISTTVVVEGSDEDSDSDGIPDASDICPTTENSDQANADADEHGDACDPCTDTDGDGFGDPGHAANTCNSDNCPSAINFNQADLDGDGIGNVCDATNDNDEQNNDCYGSTTDTPDEDADGISDCIDNCPATYNAKQRDTDADGIGNDCDLPVICPAAISCVPPPDLELGSTVPLVCSFQPDNYDSLVIFVGNKKFENITSSLSTTLNAVGTYKIGAHYAYLVRDKTSSNFGIQCTDSSGPTVFTTVVVKEKDADSDGRPDSSDNCPSTANPNQANKDADGHGDICDPCTDTDADGFGNPGYPANTCNPDNCPATENSNQEDLDTDGIGDVCDPPACGNGFQEMGEACDATEGCPADCIDHCLDDPAKLEKGQCGCGVAETDTDSDGVANCKDSEECDGLDNNGNGSIDDGFDVGTICSVGVGVCATNGKKVCTANKNGTECSATAGTATNEICDGLDNDCDGKTDENLDQPTTCGVGECASMGVVACSGGMLQADTCQPKSATVENCDNLDNDCNGVVDNDVVVANDGNVCTDDVCVNGAEAHLAKTDETNCNDGDICNGSETCQAGVCASGTPLVCDDGNACNGLETCDGAQGCVGGVAPDCGEDNNVCNGVTSCDAVNGCVTSAPLNCDDGNACTTASCDAAGGCQQAAVSCDDGDACNGVETCDPTSGCLAGTPPDADGDGIGNCSDQCEGADDKLLGGPCTVGVGQCQNTGSNSCVGGAIVCNAQPHNPSAEGCDGLDNDCDGATDEDLTVATTCGVGACTSTGAIVCSSGTLQGDTCQSKSATIELCGDGVDNDCNGSVDDGFDVGTECSAGVGACKKQGQKVCTADKNGTECNAIAGITTIEVCDGVDNDCDGATDENLTVATTCGVGACASTGSLVCSGGMPQADTCQPKSATVESCDNMDNDCDSATDENLTVATSCGVGECAAVGVIACSGGQLQADTCQPKNGSAEVCDDLDNNCNGIVDEDLTVATTCGVGECASTGVIACSDGITKPDTCTAKNSSAEVCDGLDNNCDGAIDENLDKPTTCGIGECSATGVITCSGGVLKTDTCTAKNVNTEICDDLDNDCDGEIDENLDQVTQCGVGACQSTGQIVCSSGVLQSDTCQISNPAIEVCDGLDNDCDGATDEDLTQECYSGDPVSKGVGICVAGSQSCEAGVWSACAGEVLPSNNENCDNSLDDNCDGETNEDCEEDVCQPVLVKTYEEPVNGENDGNAEKIIAEGSNDNSYKLQIIGAVRLSRLINVGKEYILFVDDKSNAYSVSTKDVANEEVEARRLFTINGFIDWAADSKTGVRILTTGGLRDIPDITAESFPPQEEWQKVLDTQELGTYSRLAVTEQGQNEIVTWLQGTNRISRLNVQEEKLVIEPVIHCSQQSALSIRSFISRNNQFYLYNNDGTIYRTSSSCEELSEIFKPASEQTQATPTDLPTDVLALDPQSKDIYFYNTSATSPGISRLHFVEKVGETTPLTEVQLHSNGRPHSFAVITQCAPTLKIVIVDKSMPEVCDSKDNDLDGKTDEDCECNTGETQNCGTDEGECEQGEQVCLDTGKWSDECAGSVGPATEECDGKDNNCDGQIDENSNDGCKAEEKTPAASGETSPPTREDDAAEADDAPDEILDETDGDDAPGIDDSGENDDTDGTDDSNNTNRAESAQSPGCSLNPASVDTPLIFLLLISFLIPYCLRTIFLRSK